MSSSPHRILRQVLELDLRVPLEAAPALQEQAARVFRDGDLPGLETLFDRLAGGDRLIRLERLELDLGELRGRDWPRQLSERLAQELAGRLAEAVPAATRGTPAGSLAQDFAAERTAGDGGAAAPREQGPLEALRFYLEQGRLPWWGTLAPGGWHACPPEAFAAGAGSRILDLLRRRPELAARLEAVAGDRLLESLSAALAGIGGAEAALHRLAPAGVLPGSPGWAAWRCRFWSDLLAAAPGLRPDPASGVRLLRRWLAELPPAEAAEIHGSSAPSVPLPSPWREWREAAEAAAAPAAPASSAAAPPGASRLSEAASEGASRLSEAASEGASRLSGRAADDAFAGTDLPGASRLDERVAAAADGLAALSRGASSGASPGASRFAGPAAQAGAGEAARLEEGEAVYLAGAGLVILHPFLPELFASRGLLEERKRFRGEAERHRAAHLLGELAFGAAAPEYQLLLPKLLCGLAWDEVLPPADLDEQDRAACGELLAAVLRHWTALRSSSPAWLREQFLLRDGKLERVDDGFRLTVESRAQDVLLARLPWGLGTVRLPWLAANLHIGWIG